MSGITPGDSEPVSQQPTDARAGSEEKILVMITRARAHLPLFVAGDNTEIDHEPPVQAAALSGLFERESGVRRHKNRFRARLCLESGREISLGVYATRAEAEAAVRAEKKRQGQGQ